MTAVHDGAETLTHDGGSEIRRKIIEGVQELFVEKCGDHRCRGLYRHAGAQADGTMEFIRDSVVGNSTFVLERTSLKGKARRPSLARQSDKPLCGRAAAAPCA